MKARRDATRHDSRDGSQDNGAARGRLRLRSASPEQTRRLGAALGRLLAAGDVVLLTGALGAGKTAFTQGIGAGLGVTGTINSPTFTIVKEYDARVPLYHLDLYRIEDPDELFALGFEEYFGGAGVVVVEWAERGEREGDHAVWPDNWLRLTLQATGMSERRIDVTAAGERGEALLAAFARAVGVAPASQPQANPGETVAPAHQEDA